MRTITHHEMEYTIYQRPDGKFDVCDVSPSRPIGLRDSGPWESEEEAEQAVRNMTLLEARE